MMCLIKFFTIYCVTQTRAKQSTLSSKIFTFSQGVRGPHKIPLGPQVANPCFKVLCFICMHEEIKERITCSVIKQTLT